MAHKVADGWECGWIPVHAASQVKWWSQLMSRITGPDVLQVEAKHIHALHGGRRSMSSGQLESGRNKDHNPTRVSLHHLGSVRFHGKKLSKFNNAEIQSS